MPLKAHEFHKKLFILIISHNTKQFVEKILKPKFSPFLAKSVGCSERTRYPNFTKNTKYDHHEPASVAQLDLGPNIHWTSNYGICIVFIGNMLSWLSFHNFV